MRPSSGTRSPGWARRCATVPLIGAVRVASLRDLRASSTAASAACSVAWAPASVETEVSSAVGEMKPWATSAWLLVRWRWAISCCARAALACCSAWRKRQSNSVGSSWPMTWPALTVSPSRTVRVFNSAATRALTKALSTAFRLPEISSVRVSGSRATGSTSSAASSSRGADAAAIASALADEAGAAAPSALRNFIHRHPPQPSNITTTANNNQRIQDFMGRATA